MGKYLFSISYAIITAFSVVLIHASTKNLAPIVSLWITAFFALLYFHLLNLAVLPKIYRQALSQKWSWLGINIIIAGMWLATFYGTAWAGGFNFIFIYFVTAAMISFFVLWRREHKKTSTYLIAWIGLLALLLVFMLLEQPKKLSLSYELGIALSFIGGVCGYLYRKESYEFAGKTGLSATQILSIRFYGIILIGIWFLPHHMTEIFNGIVLVQIFLIALFSFILPNYLNQVGILKVGAETHSIIVATCPMLTYLIQATLNQHWSPILIMISVIACMLLAFPALTSRYKSAVQ